MKLHWSVKRGGIIVKTYKEHLLTFVCLFFLLLFSRVCVYVCVCVCVYVRVCMLLLLWWWWVCVYIFITLFHSDLLANRRGKTAKDVVTVAHPVSARLLTPFIHTMLCPFVPLSHPPSFVICLTPFIHTMLCPFVPLSHPPSFVIGSLL